MTTRTSKIAGIGGALMLAASVLGCASSTPTPEPTHPGFATVEGEACLAEAMPDEAYRVRAERGGKRAFVFAGTPDAVTGLEVICVIPSLETRAGVEGTWSEGGTIEWGQAGRLTADRIADEDGDRLMAGRTPEVAASVTITLDDGVVVDAAVGRGFYLGWWETSAAHPVLVVATASDGSEVGRLDSPSAFPPRGD